MTRVRIASVLLGVGFGFCLAWGQFIDPDRIRDMLLLRDPYMWLMFATAVSVGFVGLRVLRRRGARAILTGERVSWETPPPERRHVVGAAIFGVGWAVSDVCPGPILVQLGQGIAWSLFLFAGVWIGITLFFRRQEAPAERRDVAIGKSPLPASNPE